MTTLVARVHDNGSLVISSETLKELGVEPGDEVDVSLQPHSIRREEPVKSDAGEPESLADLFAGRIGGINSGGKERLSEDGGQKFADYLEQKRREGHL